MSCSTIAPSRPSHPTDPDDPAYRWPPEFDGAARQAARYHIATPTLAWATVSRPRRSMMAVQIQRSEMFPTADRF
jgi:hypothetical protein